MLQALLASVNSMKIRWKKESRYWKLKAGLHDELTAAENVRCRLTNPRILPVSCRPRLIRVQHSCDRATSASITLSVPSRRGSSCRWLIVGMNRMSYRLFRSTSGLNTSCFPQPDCSLAFGIGNSVARQCRWFTIMSCSCFRLVCYMWFNFTYPFCSKNIKY